MGATSVVDAKEREIVTDWEDWWSTIILPYLQSRSLRDPMRMFDQGDYTYFARFDGPIPEYLKPHIEDETVSTGTDIKQILKEDLHFVSSSDKGLELADILVNATRRALNGNLTVDGWKAIPQLMIHRGDQYFSFLSLMPDRPGRINYPYKDVIRHFRKDGRNMLDDRFLRS